MLSSTSPDLHIEPNRRVLIIDDNDAIHGDFLRTLGAQDSSIQDELEELEEALFGGDAPAKSHRYELSSAYQGEEGLQMIRLAREGGQPYALAFVDVRMPPGMDGIETTARILETDPDINVVICSAYSDHSWEEMIDTIGETDRVLILKKPFDTIEVRQIAHSLERRWRLSRIAEMKLEDLTTAVESRTRELEDANSRLQEEIEAKKNALAMLADSNERIRALAYKDGLTGLPNRRLLNEHLAKLLARSLRTGSEFAVLFVDLDNFKLINDTYGHQAADLLLKEFSDSLEGLVRSEDILAAIGDQEAEVHRSISLSLSASPTSVLSRLGGDEFVILLPDTKDLFSASTVARRILERAETAYRVEDKEIFLTVSIGIANFPDDGGSPEELLRNADTAMYHAKQMGKAGYQYYSSEMNKASVDRVMLENGLRRALETNALELHYQPQIDLSNHSIVGAEALLRWKDSTRGYIPPSTFIPIAEDAGLILPVGAWVIRETCRQIARWRSAGMQIRPVSVNVSAIQFHRQDLVGVVRAALGEFGVDPSELRLEITESSLISFNDRAHEILEEFRRIGIEIALDDFGTGYSSLSYLRSVPLDVLKIDRSFVSEMLTDEKTGSITEAIIAMARVLRLRVVAEGIENADQLRFIRQLGCTIAQGYYFSAAVPAEEYFDLVLASKHKPLGAFAAPAEASGGPDKT